MYTWQGAVFETETGATLAAMPRRSRDCAVAETRAHSCGAGPTRADVPCSERPNGRFHEVCEVGGVRRTPVHLDQYGSTALVGIRHAELSFRPYQKGYLQGLSDTLG
jgi:hypothetical protein